VVLVEKEEEGGEELRMDDEERKGKMWSNIKKVEVRVE
jgi:hypothetical protein